MSVFFIGQGIIKDRIAFVEYSTGTLATFAPFGGAMIARGLRSHELLGARGADITIIVRFPDMASVEAWYASDAYQALIPVRERALDLKITVFNEPV